MAKYLLIQKYEGGNCDQPMGAWNPADIRGHIDFQVRLNEELAEAGELVDAQGVGEAAKRVVSDGSSTTVTVPQGEVLLAGYRLIDVESEERALQIAARSSAAPGPAGRALEQPIEVRQIMVGR
jgi:hypothetical protein